MQAAAGEPLPPSSAFSVKTLPGISGPLGFFDPLGFCTGASEGKIKFYRGASSLLLPTLRSRARNPAPATIHSTPPSIRPSARSARALAENGFRALAEVELKHGRAAMLAALGFLVGEHFHPLFGGSIDVPSYIAFQETPLQTFWPAVVGTSGRCWMPHPGTC